METFMNWTTLRRGPAGAVTFSVALIGTILVTGCDMLEVSDPTAIEASELNTPAGVNLMRTDALSRVYAALSDASVQSALVSDELIAEWPLFWYNRALTNPAIVHTPGRADRREPELQAAHQAVYVKWQDARYAAAVAIPAMRSFASVAMQPRVGEMFAMRGFAALRLAEDFCPGFPLHELAGFKPAYGPPLTTDQAFERALADFDSALANAGDSVRIQNLARVERGRALLALGRFADAAQAVASVPTTYNENAIYSDAVEFEFEQFQLNAWGSKANMTLVTDQNYAIANREGGNGMNFVTPADPRLALKFLRNSDRDGFALNVPLKYPTVNSPIVIASGVEARLIEAEAALKAGGASWLTILNDLRATRVTPAMPPLTDPGNDAARVDLVFRERAFWLYGTGHRLGDLRRLIARYGRTAATVFPTGTYRLGGNYTTVTNMAFNPDLEMPFSPDVTGCTSR
jgi:starch-binding outer membrane protein, SusD/RagB family